MSKYTTQIRTYIESGGVLFDFDYPIFNEDYRPILEKNIIENYYFREIGLETMGQFKWFLKSKMNRIMPYYNSLYETTGLISKDDYNINLNTVETHTRDVTSSNTGKLDSNAKSTSNGSANEIFSDTPQAKLQKLDYATNLSEHESNASDTSQGSSLSTTSHDQHETFVIEMVGGGGLKYNAQIIMEWRQTLINVDQLIINDLSDLFLNIY
jgi:hypothetical protein